MFEGIQISAFIRTSPGSVDSSQTFPSISYQWLLSNLIALLCSPAERSSLQGDCGESLANIWYLELKCVSICVSERERKGLWMVEIIKLMSS